MKKPIKIILLLICAIVFIISAYKIYQYISEKNESNKLNQDLINKAVTQITGIPEKVENTSPISVDFLALQQENSDIVGWLYSEGTPINYPVAQGKDNNYYLRRMINGSENIEGTIFMDYRNNSDITDNNTIIYGHNMKSGTKFGTLQNYKKQEYYENHKEIYYFTPEKNYKIELFAGATVSVNSSIYNLENINQEKLEEIIQNSDFKSDIEINEEDKFLTLSTCAYEYEGARYIVMGVIREQ